MGRIKKYNTPKEKKLAQKQASNKYYWENKTKEDDKARERYWRKKL